MVKRLTLKIFVVEQNFGSLVMIVPCERSLTATSTAAIVDDNWQAMAILY